jgi:hypothetical protein
MLEPALDISSRDPSYSHADDGGETFEMDSPSQVYHQLTDPLDGPEPTDVDSDGDDEYIDRAEDDEDKGSARARGPQKQNHRKTFKIGLWE